MPPAAVPFGNYLLLERLAIGGMAEVYLAKSADAARGEKFVAVKRILPTIAEDHEFVAMFIDEAKIAGQLNHGNIARIFDLGKMHASYFIAMEYVPGPDLRSIWDLARGSGGIPLNLACHIVTKLCEGLDYAHRRRDARGEPLHIIHRDVSPQNVIVSFDGDVKIIDFGIAKAAGRAVKTQTGVLKGKFAYMAPEQARGEAIDHRVDIFAVGVILYELCTGERLYKADSDFLLLEKVRAVDIVPPSQVNPRVVGELEDVILKALSRDVDQRYAWASSLQTDLERFMVAHELSGGRDDLSAYVRRAFADDAEQELVRLEEYRHVAFPTAGDTDIEGGSVLEDLSSGTAVENPAADVTLVHPSPFEELPSVNEPEGQPTEVVDAAEMIAQAREEILGAAAETSERSGDTPVEEPLPDRFETSLKRVPIDPIYPSPRRRDEDSLPPPAPIPPTLGESVLINEARVMEPASRTGPGDLSDWERRLAAASIPVSRARLGLAYGAGVLTVLVGLVGLRLLGGPPTGHLVVLAEPRDTEVSVDEQQRAASTPARFELAEGSHTVVLQRPGVAPIQRSVDIQVGAVELIEAIMPRGVGTVVVQSDPEGAEVLLDGEAVGTTPLTLSEVAAEQPHTLSFEHKLARPATETVTVGGGGQVEVRALLPYKNSRVEVRPTPDDAVIYWDGRWRRGGVIPKVAFGQAVELKIRRPGCTDHQQEVKPAGEKELVVAPELQCGPIAEGGLLTVTSPFKGRVFVDDIDLGKLPLLRYPLPVGSYQLEVRGRRSTARETVQVTAGEVVQLRMRVR